MLRRKENKGQGEALLQWEIREHIWRLSKRDGLDGEGDSVDPGESR